MSSSCSNPRTAALISPWTGTPDFQRGASLAAYRYLRRHPDGEEQRDVSLRSPLCGNGYLARRWALAGRGIALKALFDVIDDLEEGRLRRVLPGWSGGRASVHAVFPSRRFQPARVRALHAAVAERFAERGARCAAWLARSGGEERGSVGG